MSNTKFVSWINRIKQESGGFIENILFTLKIDGFSAKFGKDESGNIFLEGARTGPIFDPDCFGQYARSRTNDPTIILRADHYGDLLRLLKEQDFVKFLPLDTKVYCEVFYNPLAKEDEDGLTFVSVKYDKSKIGSLMTIMPYNIYHSSTGEEVSYKEWILKFFYSVYDTPEIRFIDPRLDVRPIDINIFINQLNDDNIQQIKEDLASMLLMHPHIEDKYKLGPNLEGIVIWLDKPYKIVTSEFRESHRKVK